MVENTVKHIVSCIGMVCLTALAVFGQLGHAELEGVYYDIRNVNIPQDIVLEVGGMAFDDKGRLGICTRRGEVWIVDEPASDNPIYRRYAHGLHEPLGLAFKGGSFYCAQRGELTRMQDTDGDDRADIFERIYRWDLVGNYHEYSYGPLFLPDGDMLVALNLGWVGRGASLSKWRGWILKISPEGDMTPIATGMRSPAGMGLNAEGDVFYTENQGDWVGSGRMTHIEHGDFVGHPEGLKWSAEPNSPLDLKMEDIDDTKGLSLYEYAQEIEAVKAPSVWFPHTLMGISTSDLAIIPEGFGPFAGQLLIGDQGHSKIMRVFQEKVNGVYQGICFPFREGFSSGLLRMIWGPDGSLYAGMTNRGWASTGTEPYGLQRLIWKGQDPFEIQKVNVESDGFTLTFTKPVDRRSAADPDSYQITDFTYQYHHLYGSPVIDNEVRTVFKVEVAQDGLSARLRVEGLRLGYIYEIDASGVSSEEGSKLLHQKGYYTLNELPDGQRLERKEVTADLLFEPVEVKSAKRVTQMPDTWTDGPDQTVTVGTLPGMQFDLKEISVKAGSKVKLIFNNPDDMMHNLLIVMPGQADAVGDAALQLGLQGQQKGYIPDQEAILAHTTLLEPGGSDIIYFTAPETPGNYQYVCTFPGHAALMRGILRVEPSS